MNWYSKFIFPRICDLLLGSDIVTERRKQILTEAKGRILEIGLGTALNLPCYPAEVRKITTVDPNPGMHRLAHRRIKETGVEVDHRPIGVEQLPFDDHSFDCVVSTFTLCSIFAVERAMGEVHRVLRPGGVFLFLEHGLSPDSNVQKWQQRLNWLQQRLADGCHLDRDIERLVAGQPFATFTSEKSYLEKTPKTHGYLYQGTAVK